MKRSNGLRRSPAKRRRLDTGPSRVTVELVLLRDGYACVVCGLPVYGERGRNWSVQHRRPRGMGGTVRPETNSPANLLTVHGSGTDGCHGWIEANRIESLENGWLIPQTADPFCEPVVVGAGRRIVWLTDDGKYSAEPPEVSA